MQEIERLPEPVSLRQAGLRLGACLVGFLLCCLAVAETGMAGRALSEVLSELRSRGLRVVFSTGVVLEDMIVPVDPESDDPRAILDEILSKHGLVAREGVGGILVVVRENEGPEVVVTGIRGWVTSTRGGIGLAGVEVEVLGLALGAVSDAQGRFELMGIDPGIYDIEARLPGFVVSVVSSLEVASGQWAQVEISLRRSPPSAEQIDVSPSRLTLLQQDPASMLALDRNELLQLPHLGGDIFRALPLMPGIVANDVSARFHVRGGRRDEVQILVDGQEIYEAFHLSDFDGALSIVEAENLDRVDLSTGGFPGQYGDRMSGVLDMTTVEIGGEHRYHLGVGVLTLEGGGSGLFADDRGSWLLALRRGSTDIAGRLLGRENPKYGDLFGKTTWSLSPRQDLRLNVLAAVDELDFTETTDDGEFKRWDTNYENAYTWLTHEALVGDRLLIESALSWSKINRSRDGLELEEEQEFLVLDSRELEIASVRQAYSLQAGTGHAVRWGFEVRNYDAEFDYFGERAYDTPLADIRALPGDGEITFVDEIEGRHDGFYVSDKIRLFDRLTIDLGLRFDRLELLDEDFFSPRVSASWALGPATVLRAAWGHYYQSQRPYELQVEDGETEYAPVERSEHRIVGFEHHFGLGSPLAGWALRLEAYRHRIRDPRARYENLYEAINVFPEMEPDRVRVAPESSRSEGIELLVRGRLAPGLDLRLSYAYSSIEDRIDGSRVPRQIDQPHALNLVLGYRFGPRWTLSMAWRYHTGWPITPISLQEVSDPDEEEDWEDGEGDGDGDGDEEDGETEYEVVLGPLNSLRLPSYHRLDLRVSRRWPVRRGELTFYVDIQNVYNRKNVAGFDIEIDDEEGELLIEDEAWPGIFPSLGIRWKF